MISNDEAEARIRALDEWVFSYPRSKTFRLFWEDYRAQDPQLHEFLEKSERESWSEGVVSALNALDDGMDTDSFLYSRDRPYRRIDQGPSYSDGRDDTFDDLYATMLDDHQVSEAMRAMFDAIKERLHSDEWIGKPRREQLDWLDREPQCLISRIQTLESAAVVHAYLFEHIDKYDVEGADLDAPVEKSALPPA